MRLLNLTSIALALFLSGTSDATEQCFSGTVAGDADEATVRIRLDDAGDALHARLDLPYAGTLGIPSSDVDWGRRSVRISFLDDAYVFEGKRNGESIDGSLYLRATDSTHPVVLTEVPDTRPYTAQDVRFESGAIELAGTVFTPNGPGPHPGIMLIHGSGDNERWWREHMADFFARQGFATLYYDKRGNGESGGDWKTVGFGPLAEDAVAGVHYLQSLPQVDAEHVGLWGISQAGWIMPLAASMSDDIRFIVVTSGTTVSVAEEIKYDYLVNLRDQGFSDADIAKAEAILDMDHEVTMTGEGYDELRAKVKEIRREPWWRALNFFVLPPTAKPQMQLIGGFDPRPVLEEVDIPILWIYGWADKSVDPNPAIAILDELIAEYDKPWTIRTFDHADHGMRVPAQPGAALPLRTHAPGYFDAISAWLQETVPRVDS